MRHALTAFRPIWRCISWDRQLERKRVCPGGGSYAARRYSSPRNAALHHSSSGRLGATGAGHGSETRARSLDRGLITRLLDYMYLLQWMERVETHGPESCSAGHHRTLAAIDPDAVRAGLDSEVPEGRLFCYSVLLTDLDKQTDLVDRAIDDDALLIRLWLLNKICEARPAEPPIGWAGCCTTSPLRSERRHFAAPTQHGGSIWNRRST